ncbi:MAG: hypothetical protein ACOC95_01335 [Planctomycetota bacterium]
MDPSALIASSSPYNWGHWFIFHGSLHLETPLAVFIATVVLIVRAFGEMSNRVMIVAGTLACIVLAAFVAVGFTVPKLDARAVCFVLTGAQWLIFVSPAIRRKIRSMSWMG